MKETQTNMPDEENEGSCDQTRFQGQAVILAPEWTGLRILVFREPENALLSMPRVKTARQLLEKLGFAEEEAIVAREGELLTPDRRIWPHDRILVRGVVSKG